MWSGPETQQEKTLFAGGEWEEEGLLTLSAPLLWQRRLAGHHRPVLPAGDYTDP